MQRFLTIWLAVASILLISVERVFAQLPAPADAITAATTAATDATRAATAATNAANAANTAATAATNAANTATAASNAATTATAIAALTGTTDATTTAKVATTAATAAANAATTAASNATTAANAAITAATDATRAATAATSAATTATAAAATAAASVITAAATANNAATTAATTANTAATSATTAATTAVAAATAATAAATTATAAAAGNSIADTAAAIKNSDIQIGIGLGFSASPQTTYSYTLTAPDHFLQRQPESYSFPVVSAVICYNPSYYFIKQGDEDKPAAQQNTELQAGRYAWLAAVNLNDVFTSNLDFNQRISLGLGGGRRFGTSNHFYIGIFAEGVLRRFLRDAYDGRLGNTLPAFPVNNIPSIVTTLNLNDETYFVTRPVFSVALKFIYIISGGAPKIPVSGEKNK